MSTTNGMVEAQRRRDKFRKELEAITPGWETDEYKGKDSYNLVVSENITVSFIFDGPTKVLFCKGSNLVANDSELIGTITRRLNFDTAYRTFLLEKDIQNLAIEMRKTRELFSNGIEFSPGSEAVKELEKEFDKLKTSV